MPAGKLVFSGMELVKSSRGGSSVRISVWRGTNTGGRTTEERIRFSSTRFVMIIKTVEQQVRYTHMHHPVELTLMKIMALYHFSLGLAWTLTGLETF